MENFHPNPPLGPDPVNHTRVQAGSRWPCIREALMLEHHISIPRETNITTNLSKLSFSNHRNISLKNIIPVVKNISLQEYIHRTLIVCQPFPTKGKSNKYVMHNSTLYPVKINKSLKSQRNKSNSLH